MVCVEVVVVQIIALIKLKVPAALGAQLAVKTYVMTPVVKPVGQLV